MSPVALITGAAGYIGSHACLKFLEAGYRVLALDNFQNSSPQALKQVARLAGKEPKIIVGDVRCAPDLESALLADVPDVVVHFAGVKSVAESVTSPEPYYEINTFGTLQLLKAVRQVGCRRVIFSSSATVYGEGSGLPLTEEAPVAPSNPYGRSKLAAEQILIDAAAADSSLAVCMLRYFNPVGAHESGLIGEDPIGEPANLFPFVAQVAVGRREKVRVFGQDWPTKDGTGVRDYIHVEDLVEGHLSAVELVRRGSGATILNLGTGHGFSVLDVIRNFEAVSGRKIPIELVGRRPGDVSEVVADASKAGEVLFWSAKRGIRQMCEDHWRWQKLNPAGYEQRLEC